MKKNSVPGGFQGVALALLLAACYIGVLLLYHGIRTDALLSKAELPGSLSYDEVWYDNYYSVSGEEDCSEVLIARVHPEDRASLSGLTGGAGWTHGSLTLQQAVKCMLRPCEKDVESVIPFERVSNPFTAWRTIDLGDEAVMVACDPASGMLLIYHSTNFAEK